MQSGAPHDVTAPHGAHQTSATQQGAPHHTGAHGTHHAAGTHDTHHTTGTHGKVQTTADRASMQPSSTGPAHYTGGAPMPDYTPAGDPNAQREREQEHEQAKTETKLEHAKAAHEANKEEKRGMAEKAKSAVGVAVAQASAKAANVGHAMEGKLKKKSNADEEKWFQKTFPQAHEEIQVAYHCTYVDGKSTDHTGTLAVTDGGVHFADYKDEALRESVPYKMIASFEKKSNNHLNIYTTDRRLFQFKTIRPKSLHSMEIEDAAGEARTWMDHHWRKVSEVPNPAATYCSS